MSHSHRHNLMSFLLGLMVTVMVLPTARLRALTRMPSPAAAALSLHQERVHPYRLNGQPLLLHEGWSDLKLEEVVNHWRVRMPCEGCGLELKTSTTTLVGWWSAGYGLSALDLFSLLSTKQPSDSLKLHLGMVSGGNSRRHVLEWATAPGFSPAEALVPSGHPTRVLPRIVAPEGELLWTLVADEGSPRDVTLEVWLLDQRGGVELDTYRPGIGRHPEGDSTNPPPSPDMQPPVTVLLGRGGDRSVAVLVQTPSHEEIP